MLPPMCGGQRTASPFTVGFRAQVQVIRTVWQAPFPTKPSRWPQDNLVLNIFPP